MSQMTIEPTADAARRWAVERYLTQEELAERLGVDLDFVKNQVRVRAWPHQRDKRWIRFRPHQVFAIEQSIRLLKGASEWQW